MANNTARLEYDKNERTNSEVNEQTIPEDHTNSMEWTPIMAECRHMTKIISRTELRKLKQNLYKINIKKYLLTTA